MRNRAWQPRLAPHTAARLVLARVEPLLIRQPLIEVDDWRTTGFDAEVLEQRLGIRLGDGTPEGCSRTA